jgi:hypothetical protein
MDIQEDDRRSLMSRAIEDHDGGRRLMIISPGLEFTSTFNDDESEDIVSFTGSSTALTDDSDDDITYGNPNVLTALQSPPVRTHPTGKDLRTTSRILGE